MQPTNETFVIHHQGTYLYAVSPNSIGDDYRQRQQAVLYADEQPMTLLSATADRWLWFAADHRARQLWIQRAPEEVLDGYRLDNESRASALYPLTMTPVEFQERARRFSDDECDFYSKVTHHVPRDRELFADGADAWPVIEGFAPEYRAGGPRWTPSLPTALLQRPEYHHLFPGSLHGLRDHLAKKLGALPQVRYAISEKTGPGVAVALALSFEQPVTEFVPDPSSRRGVGTTRIKKVERRILLPIPDSVAGADYRQALAAWDCEVERWLAVVRSATVEVCGHCDGEGYLANAISRDGRTPAVGATSPSDPEVLGRWLRALPLGAALRTGNRAVWQVTELTTGGGTDQERTFTALESPIDFGPFEITDGHFDLARLAEQAPFTLLDL